MLSAANSSSAAISRRHLAMQEITRLSAGERLGLYGRRELSPVEATQAVLERIEAQNAASNAYCLVRGDEALAAASESERRWQAGEPAGLPGGGPPRGREHWRPTG